MARIFTFTRLQLAFAAGLMIAAPFATASSPNVSWSVSIGGGYPAPVYVQPAPPVVYVPAPVYVRPQPVYVQPTAVIHYGVPPGHWKRRHWGHGPHHGPHGHRGHHH